MLTVMKMFALSILATCIAATGRAHENHVERAGTESVAALPRIALHSERLEVVGILKSNKFIIFVDRFSDNSPVTDAKVTVSINGAEFPARAEADGTYVVDPPDLPPGRNAKVSFKIVAGLGDDLISGELAVPDMPKAVARVPTPVPFLSSHIRIGPIELEATHVIAFGALVSGIGIGLLLKGRNRQTVPTTALALLAILVLPAPGRAHEGDDDRPAARSGRPQSDMPQRLPDGTVFFPKPTQRLLEVRTTPVKKETAKRALRFVGRVVADPNRSGLVQSINGGRVIPPAAGLPRLGQVVAKGDVLATIEPALALADRTTIAERSGEIEQLIAQAEVKERRIRQLVERRAAPESQVVDVEVELAGLRKRLEIVKQTRVEAEVLRAPVGGLIAAARAQPGQVVQAQDLLFQIVDPQALWVEALMFTAVDPSAIEEPSAVAANNVGMRLSFLGFSKALQQQARIAQFAIVDPPLSVSIGQPVSVIANDTGTMAGMVLPREAVVRNANGFAVVWRHTEPEEFEAVAVRVEILDATRVVIVTGLDEGDRIVTQGAELINQVR